MVVSLLLKILNHFSLSKKGVQIQFVTHKHDYWWEDEIYDDCILVTPYDNNGNLNHYRGRYFHDVNFKLMDKRNALCELVSHYNKMNHKKDNFIPIRIGSNYCTFK